MTDTQAHRSGSARLDPATMSGLEMLRHFSTLEQPPPTLGELLGIKPTRLEFGEVHLELTTRPMFANPFGAVHGGLAATLLDSVMGCAVHSTLAAGDRFTTLELKVNYIQVGRTDGQRFVAEGHTVHVGRSIATAEARVHDGLGILVAHGTTTCLIRRAAGGQ